MRMMRIVLLTVGCAVATFANAGAAPITIPVLADASVHADAPDTNFGGDDFGGGLRTGTTEFDELFRFYLKFDLAATLGLGAPIGSATLRGFYSDDWDFFVNETHSLSLAASDTWSESGITWNNQPGASGGPLAVFNAADYGLQRTNSGFVGRFIEWDLTNAVKTQSLADGVLSLLFRADNEALGNSNLEFLASKEFDPDLAFQLEVRAVPEPGTVALLGAGLVLVFSRCRRRSSASSRDQGISSDQD